jgi:hypothetical protein
MISQKNISFKDINLILKRDLNSPISMKEISLHIGVTDENLSLKSLVDCFADKEQLNNKENIK